MHCKDVSMREVDIPLTREAITDLMDGWTSYKRTDSLVLKHGDEYAVVHLNKVPGEGLFRETSHNEILSLPEDTVFVEDPEMDVLNTPAMAALQMRHPGKTVIVRGMFSHISFVHGLVPLRLVVTDSIPPTPCKLAVLVQRALDSGFVDLPVVMETRIIDMADRIPEVRTPAVMFPCRVSHLTADIPFYFLDDAPKDLDEPVTLIGCHLSERIFRELYGRDVPLLSVCPADYIRPGERTIVKCCKVKEGHVRTSEDVVQVPWGATVPEIVDAINDLFSDRGERSPSPLPLLRELAAAVDGPVPLPDVARPAQQVPEGVPGIRVVGIHLQMQPHMGYGLVQPALVGQPGAVAPAVGLLVRDPDGLQAGLLQDDLDGVLGEPRRPGADQLGEPGGLGLVDLEAAASEYPAGDVHGVAAEVHRHASGLRHLPNLTVRPHSSLRDVPNSESPAMRSLENTGPSLQTLASSMTQHPQTPAPHFM